MQVGVEPRPAAARIYQLDRFGVGPRWLWAEPDAECSIESRGGNDYARIRERIHDALSQVATIL